MTISGNLFVKELVRTPKLGPEDHLSFVAGVNVIVGAPNTGKTKWLQMLDYVLGNDGVPEDVFGEDIAGKYEAITAHLCVAGEELTVERRWKELGSRGKVFVNGEPWIMKDFLHDLLRRLGIPVLHYPQGNPLGQRTWPELGWRSLYRHMYRRQNMWGDIADRQFESEQHACVLQFTGLAERLFSDTFGQLVAKQRKITELQASKDQYMAVLTDVAIDLLTAEELGVGVTPKSIEAARQRTQSEIAVLGEKREQLLVELSNTVSQQSQPTQPSNSLDNLMEHLASLQVRQDEVLRNEKQARERLNEMTTYRTTIEAELGRLERAQKAGALLADLKVTHCPACDNPVATLSQNDPRSCYLCKRPIDSSSHGTGRIERLMFEIEQLKASLAEADDMIGVLRQEVEKAVAAQTVDRQEIARLRAMLRPIRSAAAAVLPPEIGVIDMQIGQHQERLAQIDRLRTSLDRRDNLSRQIDGIQHEVAALEEEVAGQTGSLDFEKASDQLADGMNCYLNGIHRKLPTSWTQREVRVRISEKKFQLLVGDRRWHSQLGGTLSLFFLIAYHFGLMNLFGVEGCHFPGFLVIDLPAELEDGSLVADKENFVLEPFIDLFAQKQFAGCQMIAAGGAFENLVGAHRIQFGKIWK